MHAFFFFFIFAALHFTNMKSEKAEMPRMSTEYRERSISLELVITLYDCFKLPLLSGSIEPYMMSSIRDIMQ